jgi:hypothetical protein
VISNKHGSVAERSNARDCKSRASRLRGFESLPAHHAPVGKLCLPAGAWWILKKSRSEFSVFCFKIDRLQILNFCDNFNLQVCPLTTEEVPAMDLEKIKEEAEKKMTETINDIKTKRRKELYEKEEFEYQGSGLEMALVFSTAGGGGVCIAFLIMVIREIVTNGWAESAGWWIGVVVGFLIFFLPLVMCSQKRESRIFSKLKNDQALIKEIEKIKKASLYTYCHDEIKSLAEQTIGQGSEIGKLRLELQDKIHRTSALIEQMQFRLKQGGESRQYLEAEIERAKEVCQRFNKANEPVNSFYSKVDAFIRECFAQLKEMEAPLSDLKLIKELNELDAESRGMAERVNDLIETKAAELLNRMTEVRSKVFGQIETNGISLALEASNVKPFDDEMAKLDKIIGQFVPAEERLAKVISITKAGN